MLDRTNPRYGAYERGPDESDFISLGDIWRFLIRHMYTIGICAGLSLMAALFYVATATPIYTARAQLLIETNIPDSFRPSDSVAFSSLDAPQVETQLAIIRSERIAEKVARQLGLLDAPASNTPAGFSLTAAIKDLIQPYLAWLQPPTPPSDTAAPADAPNPLRGAIARVQGGLAVQREGYSFAINISYSDPNPDSAATLANAIANAYVEDRLEMRAQAARQGSEWLEQRIDELRKQMNAAALAVQRFKVKRDYRIVGMKQGGVRGGNAAGPGATPDRISGVTGSTSSAALDTNTADAPVAGAGPLEQAAPAPRPDAPDAADPRGAEPQQTLEELETRAESYRKIYESYLQAYADSVQRQSYPVTNARVITPAVRPTGKSHPRTKLTLAMSLVFGAFAGLGIAFVLNSLDRKVRTARQVRDELGIECLGRVTNHETMLPRLARGRIRRWIYGLLRRAIGLPDNQHDSDVAYRLSEVHDLPFSRFSTSVRSVRTAINLATKQRPLHTMGITSAMPKEGKTTFVCNLATLYAMSNVRVLVVDADVHNPTLSRILAPDRDLGLIEALEARASVSDCIVKREGPKPDILPLAGNTQAFDSAELIGSEAMRQLIEVLRKSYDLILFDLAPLKPVVDGLALCPLLDAVILVAEWGSSPVPLLAEVVHDLRRVSASPLGVVLTKVEDRSEDHYGARSAYRSRDYMIDA
jgi:capsular exopolysaccharide synthesis family protein